MILDHWGSLEHDFGSLGFLGTHLSMLLRHFGSLEYDFGSLGLFGAHWGSLVLEFGSLGLFSLYCSKDSYAASHVSPEQTS